MNKETQKRLAAEAKANERAKNIPSNFDLYADGNFVMDPIFGPVVECESHWDACLVMLAYHK